jgi:hypothetical protein
LPVIGADILSRVAEAIPGFLAPIYFESKVALPRVPADASAIIRKTWEQFQASNGGDMVNSIDQVLRRSEYSTTLATEFPKFTWNNYFMITGTYDIQVTGVYANLATLPPTFTGPDTMRLEIR